MNEAYWGWYKRIGNDINDEAIGVKAKIEIKTGSWGTQQPKGLLHLIRELELDK